MRWDWETCFDSHRRMTVKLDHRYSNTDIAKNPSVAFRLTSPAIAATQTVAQRPAAAISNMTIVEGSGTAGVLPLAPLPALAGGLEPLVEESLDARLLDDADASEASGVLGSIEPVKLAPAPPTVNGLPLASEASIVTKPTWLASVPPITRAVWMIWFAVRLAEALTCVVPVPSIPPTCWTPVVDETSRPAVRYCCC